MVYLKVSDGNETRKLQVTPGEITFDQLKEQLATFFPKTLPTGEASSGLSLQYRDTDGDVITLSSDQELQEALSQVQEDGVWKLYIRAGKATQPPAAASSSSAQRAQQSRNHSDRRLFHHLFEPSVMKPFGLFSDIWDDLEQHLQLLHHLHGEVFSSNANKADTKNGTGKGSSEAATTLEEEAMVTSSSSTEQTTAEDQEEEVKSKPQADGSEKKQENSDGDSSNNGWQTKRFVTWEPQLHVGPFGPVVYNVAYCRSSSPSPPSSCSGSSSGGQCCSRAQGGEKTKTETQKQVAAPANDEQVPTDATTTDSFQQ